MPFAIPADGRRLDFTLHGPSGAPPMLIGYPWNDDMAHAASAMLGGAIAAADIIASNAQLIAALAEDYRVVHLDYPRVAPPGDPRLRSTLRSRRSPATTWPSPTPPASRASC